MASKEFHNPLWWCTTMSHQMCVLCYFIVTEGYSLLDSPTVEFVLHHLHNG